MKYNSTRGGVTGRTFEQALFSGYASDGGILLPDVIPKVTKDTLKQRSTLSFTELAKNILALYIPEEEIPREDLNGVYNGKHRLGSVVEDRPPPVWEVAG